ncbi:MAG: hypothetical protein H0U71_09820 [Gammaproteobacteria bacterium]|nr:hypothetical protein [Gammaproteobacteria bacterium]
MSEQLIPIEEVLYVFESWTLMVKSDFSHFLESGSELLLFDSAKQEVGKAKLNRLLSSRNPNINPFEITVIEKPQDFKQVKFFKVIY